MRKSIPPPSPINKIKFGLKNNIIIIDRAYCAFPDAQNPTPGLCPAIRAYPFCGAFTALGEHDATEMNEGCHERAQLHVHVGASVEKWKWCNANVFMLKINPLLSRCH